MTFEIEVMEWQPDERLCRIMCTHLFEETEPHGRDEIPNFGQRWLSNLEHNDIKIERVKTGDLHVITKTKCGEREITIVMKEDQIVLLQMMGHRSRLEVLENNPDSDMAIKLLNLDVEDFHTFLQVNKIV